MHNKEKRKLKLTKEIIQLVRRRKQLQLDVEILKAALEVGNREKQRRKLEGIL